VAAVLLDLLDLLRGRLELVGDLLPRGHWRVGRRLGIRCLAAGLCFAALLRLVLPRRDAGMLAVRHRLVDIVVLGGMGAALFFLATTIPNQPG